MSRNARPHYRLGLGWILGVAFVDTLTRPVRLAQGFTLVRCHGSPRASSPHGLTAPGLASLDGIAACSCLWLAVATNSPREGLSPPIQCPCQAHLRPQPRNDFLIQIVGDSHLDCRAAVSRHLFKRTQSTAAFHLPRLPGCQSLIDPFSYLVPLPPKPFRIRQCPMPDARARGLPRCSLVNKYSTLMEQASNLVVLGRHVRRVGDERESATDLPQDHFVEF
jgi:hypothetical protein